MNPNGFREMNLGSPEMIATKPQPRPATFDTDVDFLRQWRAEVETMRRGGNPDWAAWSPTCLAAWAGNLIDLAAGEGIPAAWIRLESRWLGDVIRAGETREPAKPDPERVAVKFENDALLGESTERRKEHAA